MHVVGGRVGEDVGGEPAALVEGEPAHGDRLENVAVPRRIHDHATLAWFFAAARNMAGPPMSICSTHSSGDAPATTVAVNG